MTLNNSVNKNQKSFYATLIGVALPIALQGLIGSSLSLVDNLMVGSLGETELASVGIGVQIFFIFWMIIFGFTSGASTYVAQYWGQKDLKSIRKTTGFTMCITVVIGLLFFTISQFYSRECASLYSDIPELVDLAAKYIKAGAGCFLFLSVTLPLSMALRATQQTRIPLYASMSAFFINTFLNYVLIFGNFGFEKMGVEGAATATVISRFVEMSAMILVIYLGKNKLRGSIKEYFAFEKALSKKVFMNALPTTINETMWGLGMSMYIAAYARIGITELAAYRAGDTIFHLVMMASLSIGDAALILIGEKLGQGKMDEAIVLGKRIIKTGIAVGLCLGIVLVIIGKPILQLFDLSQRGEELAFAVLIIYACTMWLNMFNGINIVGILRAGGDTKFAMFAEVGTVWLVGVPITFTAALLLGWDIQWVVAIQQLEQVVKGIILWRRFISKKWVKNLIATEEAMPPEKSFIEQDDFH
ncbi:MAG: MATE family efflux transporter [Anaerovoracaceae bacterium]